MLNFLFSSTLVCFICVAFAAQSLAVDGTQGDHKTSKNEAIAKKIYRRLTGTNIYSGDSRLTEMTQAVASGNSLEAAKIASADNNFFAVTVRNWSAKWSSPQESSTTELDDMQTTAIGIIRDRIDFRKLLTGDFFYSADPNIGLPPVAPNNNRHYSDLERSGLSYVDVLHRQARGDRQAIGVFGSRGFASAYYSAGTNRRAVKFALKHFLCADITRWREAYLPDDFVRRDVNRLPTGNMREYHSECRGCHAPMDSLSGAFAFVDFDQNRVIHSTQVLPKFNLHPEVFPDGFQVQNGNWINYLAMNQVEDFGWRGATSGSTLADFSAMLSNSRGFSTCMVDNVIAEVCSPSNRDKDFSSRLTSHFERNNYDMRDVFERAAIDPSCK